MARYCLGNTLGRPNKRSGQRVYGGQPPAAASEWTRSRGSPHSTRTASPEQPDDRRGDERAAACVLPACPRTPGRLHGPRLRLAPGTLLPGHWPRATRPRFWPLAAGDRP